MTRITSKTNIFLLPAEAVPTTGVPDKRAPRGWDQYGPVGKDAEMFLL
jgi:hypothetical protein